jgi:hypothetical protein
MTLARDPNVDVLNYTAQGGKESHIGGTLTIDAGGILDCSAGTLVWPGVGTLDMSLGTLLMAAGAVTTADIAGSAVTTAKIAGSAVTTACIAAANITTALIAAGAVTLAKMTFTGLTLKAAAGVEAAGPVTVAGTTIGQRVLAVFGAPTLGGALAVRVPGTDFEAAVTVNGQIQQLVASDLSASTYIFMLAPATS